MQVNSVGFYQLSKITILPSALVVESVKARKMPSKSEMGAILLLCLGVAQATVTDCQMFANLVGIGVAAAAVCFTVTYQVRQMLAALHVCLLQEISAPYHFHHARPV